MPGLPLPVPTTPPSPLVVRWDRLALAAVLRGRTWAALGAVGGSVLIAVTALLLVPVIEGDVMSVVVRCNVALGGFSALWNLVLVLGPVLVARRGARTVPDEAIVVGPTGLHLTLPGLAHPLALPWEAVLGVFLTGDLLSVRTVRGAAPRRVLGLPTKALDVPARDVLTAAAHWSGGRVGAPPRGVPRQAATGARAGVLEG